MKKTRLSLALCALMGVATIASANEGSKLGEITVTSSTLTEHAIEDVPNTMSVITAQQIEQMGANTAYDILTKVPGLEQTNQKGSFNIRGIGREYSVVLINGRKPAVLESRHDGVGFILSSIGVSNIERVEVIRGQAGAMYGANALAGVINIITKKSLEEGGSVSVSGGNNELTSAVTYDFGRVGKWDAIFNASTTKGMGIKQDSLTKSGVWTETDTGTLMNLNLDMGYHFDENHELRFITGYIDQDRETTSGNNGVITVSNTKRRNFNNTLLYNGEVGDHSYTIGANANKSMHDSATKDYTFTDLNFNAMDTWSINDSNLLTFGVEYFDQTIEHPLATLGDNISRESLFLQDEILLFNDSVLLVPSVRYDHDSEFGGEVVPRIGATWEFIENHRLKANFGKAYITPTLVELFGFEDRGEVEVWGNPDLQPETSIGWELRYEGDFEKVRTSFGYFQADIENMIDSITIKDNNYESTGIPDEQTNINIDGTVENKGIEASLSVDFLDNFTLTGDYIWVDNKNEKGQRLANYAEQTFNLDLQYTKPEWGFSSNIWAKYNLDYTGTIGAQKGDKNSYGDDIVYDYGTLNFSMSKSFKDKYSATFAVYNLVNTNRNTANDGSVDPLEWRVSFQVKF